MLSSSLAVLVATGFNTGQRDGPWRAFWEKKLKSNTPGSPPCFTVPIFRQRMQHIIKKELEVIMSIYSWMKLWNFLMILSFFFWLRQTPSPEKKKHPSRRNKENTHTFHVQRERVLHTALLVNHTCSAKILSGLQVISCQNTQLVTGKGNLERKCSVLPCIWICLGCCNKIELRQCVQNRNDRSWFSRPGGQRSRF